MAGGVRFNIFAFDKTRRAFESVKGNLNSLEGRFKNITRGFGRIGGVMAAAFAGAGVRAIVQATDKIDKFSIRLGVSTKALSELKFAGEQTGVEFNQLSVGLQRMTRRISEVAATGKGPAVDALDELGLSAKRLAELSPDKQFMEIAKAMEEVENQSDKVRLAFKLFDSEGVGLLQTMEGGAAGIQALRDQLNDLGGTIDGPAAKSMASLNDSWNRMTVAVEGAARNLLVFLGPALEVTMDFISDLVSWIGKLIKGFRWLQHEAAKVIVRISEFTGMIDESAADRMVDKIAAQWNEISNSTGKSADNVSKFTDKMKGAAALMDGESNKTRKNKKGRGRGRGRGRFSGLDEIDDSLTNIDKIADDVAQDMRGSFSDAIAGIATDMGSLEDTAKGLFDRIKSSIVNKGADILTNSLMDFGGSMLQNFLRPSAAFVGPMNMSSGLSSMFGGGGGGGLGGIASFFGGFFADGGNFRAGKPIIVGEKGPEMIMPRQSGTVVPNHAMAGEAMTVNITVNTPNADSFRQSQGQISSEMAMAIQRARRNL